MNKQIKISKTTPVESFYIIVCGMFKYDTKAINQNELWNLYTHWQNRINKGDYQATFDYFNSSYYDGYLNNVFPEIRHDKSRRDELDSKLLNHLTNKSIIENHIDVSLVINSEKTIQCCTEFVDLYLFPNGIGIFSIKMSLQNENLNLANISDFTNKIRQLNSIIKINNEETKLRTFIDDEILNSLNLKEDWKFYNPNLKIYNIIDLKEEISGKEMDYLLYDMGNVTPLGSGKGEGVLAPSECYLKTQMNNNKLSIFKNWSSISLFDTFTKISLNYPDNFKSWELDYFHIYIHCLHLKFYMYLTNSKISDVTIITKETETIRDDFIEFINDYYQTQISYKFLPDLIQDKLLFALEIHSEIQMMETKIQRINEHAQEKRERNMNFVLMVITFLGVFSLIHDLSNWIVRMGSPIDVVFPWISSGIGVLIIASIFTLFKIKQK